MRNFIFSVLLPLVVLSFTLSAAADIDFGTALGINTAIGVALSGLQLVPVGSLAITATALLDDVRTKFGPYYKPGGQNAQRLRQLLWKNYRAWDDQFTMTPLEGDTLEYAITTHTRVLQPFKPKWSPTGQLGGNARRLTMRRVKVNVEEIPDYFVNLWLGFLATASASDPSVDRTTWPFVRWYIEVWLVNQAKQDQYMNEAYTGVWQDPGTDATPGAAGTSLDGLAYNINVDIDAGFITPISTGALSTDPETLVEQIMAFCEAVRSEYRGLPMNLNVADPILTRFKNGIREKNPDARDLELIQVPLRENITLVAHDNMLQSVGGAASNKIWMTPKDNAIKAMRIGGTDERMLKVESVDYTLKLFTDWHVAYSYWDPRIVFTNDQETDLPS